ncbi:MAG: phosphotransferase [Rhodospirillales bacterium]|nr:phosphotransferase [Rhodospirillales bacterium]
MSDQASAKAAGLSCWTGPVDPKPLGGGITNTNFVLEDAGQKYVVRIGEDIPVHGIMRFNEHAASRAAHSAGLSPKVVYSGQGVLVLDFIEGKTLEAGDVRGPEMLGRIVALLKRIHHDIPHHLEGASLVFWVFQVFRNYTRTLKADGSRMIGALPRLQDIAEELEFAVGPVQLVFGHNDLLAANFLDEGARLWIIDWDYAGFNSPLFDLANLASNNEFDVDLEHQLLESYFGGPANATLWRSYCAMKCASLMREAMWSMVSENHSELDFDYVGYTAENLERFEQAYESYRSQA